MTRRCPIDSRSRGTRAGTIMVRHETRINEENNRGITASRTASPLTDIETALSPFLPLFELYIHLLASVI